MDRKCFVSIRGGGKIMVLVTVLVLARSVAGLGFPYRHDRLAEGVEEVVSVALSRYGSSRRIDVTPRGRSGFSGVKNPANLNSIVI